MKTLLTILVHLDENGAVSLDHHDQRGIAYVGSLTNEEGERLFRALRRSFKRAVKGPRVEDADG